MSRKRLILHRWLSGLLVLFYVLLAPLSAGAAWTRPAENATWLETINAYRAHANLAALTSDAQMISDCEKHSIYMVKNQVVEHSETVGNPSSPLKVSWPPRRVICRVAAAPAR